jgi:putative transposase
MACDTRTRCWPAPNVAARQEVAPVLQQQGPAHRARLFGDDGAEIGVLKAQGAWGEIVHDLKLRQEVVRLRGRKHLAGAMNHEGLTKFIDDKLTKAKRSRRGASELTQTLRALAAAPTSVSPPAPPTAPAELTTSPAPSSSARVKPRRLSIPSGYVGSLP